jgi:hypothetical protein
MQASQTPTRVPLAFAANGTKNTIPTASQIGVTPGAASLNDGFPPLTFTPIAAGGVPPGGADFNGILNLISAAVRWQCAGGQFGYNAAFASDANVGGYPRGALLLRADQSGAWLNQTDNNATNPDTGGAGWSAAFMSGVIGQARNVAMSVTAASATATLTADEIVVGTSSGGHKYVLGAFNKTINLGAAGAGGMDTGTAPTSGYVALYAIYNPTTGASALLAVNATSAAVPNVYGGANMPSGYTASALLSVWQTNASKQFVIGYQADRNIFVVPVNVLTTSTQASTLTALSIASAVPPNAVSVSGNMLVQSSVSTGVSGAVASSASGIGQLSYSNASSSVYIFNPFTVPIITAQTIYRQATIGSGTLTNLASISSYSI